MELVWSEDSGCSVCQLWVGQKACLGFSITSYRKTLTTFLANPAYTKGPEIPFLSLSEENQLPLSAPTLCLIDSAARDNFCI